MTPDQALVGLYALSCIVFAALLTFAVDQEAETDHILQLGLNYPPARLIVSIYLAFVATVWPVSAIAAIIIQSLKPKEDK